MMHILACLKIKNNENILSSAISLLLMHSTPQKNIFPICTVYFTVNWLKTTDAIYSGSINHAYLASV